MEELQIENGQFTRIVNPLIEELIKIPFKGCELAVALFIIRKTYGYQKKQDAISLTQFQEGLKRSRQTMITALKNLQLVNVVKLVKRGSAKNDSNIWEINKYYNTWKLVKTSHLVKTAHLVKRNAKPSLMEHLNLVKTVRHTKEIYKRKNTKEISNLTVAGVKEVMDVFYKINPTLNWGNKTIRKAAADLIKKFGLEETLRMAEAVVAVQGQPYAPVATTPYDMKEKLAKFKIFFDNQKNKKPNFVQL